MRVPEGAKKKHLHPVIVRPPQSDEDNSDGESSSSDDETYDTKTQRNKFSSDKESDLSSELTEPFLQLKIGKDDTDKTIDTTLYLSRSPTRNSTKKDLPPTRPYQTNDSKRRNSLQNCGYIVADNSLNTNFQYNPTQTVIFHQNVPPPQVYEWNEPSMQTATSFSIQELERICSYWEGHPKERDEVFGNFNNFTPLSSDDVAETLAQCSIPSENNNTTAEDTSVPTAYTHLDFTFLKDNSDTQQSDDSNYGTCSYTTSPSNSLSPSSNSSSESSGYQSSSYTPKPNENCIKYAINFPSSAFDLKSQADIDNTSTILFSERHFHQNQTMPVVPNLGTPQLIGTKHLVAYDNQPAALVRTYSFSSEQKRQDKPILPKGVPVYDNPTSASERLRAKALRRKPRFSVKYIESCLIKQSPEEWSETLYEFLKEKRSPDKPEDEWLAVLYGHIECINGFATESKLQKEEKDKFANVLISKPKGQSLLYLACLNHEDLPIAARYIVEVIVKLNRDVNKSYTDDDCNSIIHVLAFKGDSHVNVLAELLSVKKDNLPVFDINCLNKRKQTPLHLAVMGHTPQNPCFSTISYLIEHGAKIFQDIEYRTPLHYAVLGECEAEIIQKILPENPSSVVDLEDLEGNTAFLLVWNNSKMCPKKKQKIIEILTKNNVNLRLQYTKMAKRQITLECDKSSILSKATEVYIFS